MRENVAVVRERERERELQSSEVGFVNNAININLNRDINKKDRLTCGKIRKKLVLLRDSLSFL